jgi:transposase-like protein
MERKDKRMHPEDVGAGSSGGKRRRHVLTIQRKVEVLRKIDRGVSVSRLRREYGVGQSTIYDIKAQKNKILQFVAESDSVVGISKRKTLRGPNNIETMQMYRPKEKFEKEWRSKSKQTTLTDLFKRAVALSNPSLSADSITRNPDNK